LPPAPGKGRKLPRLFKGCWDFKIENMGYESNGGMQPGYKKIIYGQAF
jgi:hypothetical protein